MNVEKRKIIFVYTNLGIGGIAKSLITLLKMIDYSKFDITLYIRRDDVIDLLEEVPDEVHTVLVRNEVKKRVFDKTLKGRIVKTIHGFLMKRHKYLAKQLFIRYKYPLQRKKEAKEFSKLTDEWDVAISYSTDEDDPVFVNDCLKAKKKYVFVHQSTMLAKRNIRVMKDYNRVICVNPLLVPWVEDITHHKAKVTSLENYVDNNAIIQLSHNQTEINHTETLVISTCGRLCDTKGYDCVVQIAAELKRKGLQFIWYWIGDGPAREDMERMISQCDLKDKITILGNQRNPYPYIGLCDIYVQPSRAEAYSLTIREALVLNDPVISTKTTGGKYILEKYQCGFLVDDPVKEIPSIILDLAQNHDKIMYEQEKTKRIDWEADKQRYMAQWSSLFEE